MCGVCEGTAEESDDGCYAGGGEGAGEIFAADEAAGTGDDELHGCSCCLVSRK